MPKDFKNNLWNFCKITLTIFVCFLLWFSAFKTVTSLKDIVEPFEDSIKTEEMLKMWHEQLPDNHWLKNDKYRELIELIYGGQSFAYDSIEVAGGILGLEESSLGKALGKAIEKNNAVHKSKFVLRDKDGNKVNKIRISAGEEKAFDYFYGETLIGTDFPEQSMCNSEFDLDSFALVYADKPEIATFYAGVLVAMRKGTTTVHFMCMGVDKTIQVIVR